MRLAISLVPDDPRDIVGFAELAARVGLDFVGVADTPHLRGGAFPAVQHALARTAGAGLATFVTNPVTRHPSVLAADFDALTRLYPGRVVAGIGAGDSAVRSVGLRPARPAELAEAVRLVRERAGAGLRILVAASGLRTAAAIPPEADGIIIGGGLEAGWLTAVTAAAEASAGHRLERYGFAVGTGFGTSEVSEADAGRLYTSVVTVSRHALARRPLERAVPACFVDRLVALYARYDVRAYGDPDGVNATLLSDDPELRDYLVRRFTLAGEPTSVATRLRSLGERCGLDGVVATTGSVEPLDLARRLAVELGRRL